MRFTNLFKLILCSLIIVGCSNNAQSHNKNDKPNGDDNKRIIERITTRLNDIYTAAFDEQNHDLLELDKKFMSQEYIQLQHKALEIAKRNDDVVIDADHWVQGQDWTYPTMSIKKIEVISPSLAIAHVTITSHMPGWESSVTELILPMVFERDDWYIDNMQQYYEGELLDEKAWYKQYVKQGGYAASPDVTER